MAKSWEDACALSRNSAPQGKAINKQTFAILPKIREIDVLLQTRMELRAVVREIHPEVSFAQLSGRPMINPKSSKAGQEERRIALTRVFPNLVEVEDAGRKQGLPIEDMFDATVACWSTRSARRTPASTRTSTSRRKPKPSSNGTPASSPGPKPPVTTASNSTAPHRW